MVEIDDDEESTPSNLSEEDKRAVDPRPDSQKGRQPEPVKRTPPPDLPHHAMNQDNSVKGESTALYRIVEVGLMHRCGKACSFQQKGGQGRCSRKHKFGGEHCAKGAEEAKYRLIELALTLRGLDGTEEAGFINQ